MLRHWSSSSQKDCSFTLSSLFVPFTQTREELRQALENEMRAFNIDRDLSTGVNISWNHVEFEVHYECLAEEIKIGDYYLRLLLEADENDEEISAIKRS